MLLRMNFFLLAIGLFSMVPLPFSCRAGTVEGGDHKIDLEDIERDNILSERRSRAKDAGQSHQSSSPGVQAQAQGGSGHDPSVITTTGPGGVSYSINPSVLLSHESTITHMHPVEHHSHVYDHEQAAEEYQKSKVVLQSVPAVHESTLTYVAPSRQSLGYGKASVYSEQKQYVPHQPNPQYVYIQPKSHFRSHQQPHETELAPQTRPFAPLPREYSDERYVYSRPDPVQTESKQTQQDDEESKPASPSYLQYVPYLAPGPTQEQTFVMMVPIPAGYSQHTKASGQVYPTSHSSDDVESHQPTSGQYYTSSSDEEAHPDIQYADPNHGGDYANPAERSKQVQYAPLHPEVSHSESPPEDQDRATKLHYLPPYPSRQYLPLISSTPAVGRGYIPSTLIAPTQTVDFFNPYDRQPKSLLDSYIPSWIVVQRQRALAQQHHQRQQSVVYPTHYSPNYDAYNTIAYSSPQRVTHQYIGTNHLKRSTKTKPSA